MVGAAFGAAGQRCMALSTAVLVGEAKSWLPEVGIILTGSRFESLSVGEASDEAENHGRTRG